jgi:uncharacterized cupredoxin-like copper-binding protein
MKRYAVMPIAAVFALAMAACSSSSSSSSSSSEGSSSDSSTGASVGSVVKDFSITLDQSSVAAGEVTFNISNEGPSTHEFVVIQSDLAPDALPVSDDEVQEDQVDAIGEQEDIAANTTTDLSLDLAPGSYIVFCNITGHYSQGMYAGLTVA